jgi:DNA-damage-inducible protein J
MQNSTAEPDISERSLATINVRLPQSLKEGGEAVLEREGISVSEAIRRFYIDLECRQEAPDFLKQNSGAEAADLITQKRELLKGLVGLAPSIKTREQIKDERISRHLRHGVQ